MKKRVLFLILSAFLCLSIICVPKYANAKTLNDNIEDQLNNIDFSELKDFFENNGIQVDFYEKLTSLLKGKYDFSFDSILDYFSSIFFTGIKNALPIFLSILAIVIFCELIQKIKGGFIANDINEIVNFVGYLGVTLLLISQIISVYKNTQNVLENIAKLNEIMSPIILTIMVAIGSNASASIYSPQTMLLSSIITNIFLKVILPLVIVMTIISIAQDLSGTNNLGSFIEFVTSLIKWLIGISFTVFAIFITTQGLTASTFDSASIRATKYAISNSIPLVGGFLKDGFDVMIAGSVLIKNALGIVSIITMASFIISPIIKMLSFSLMIKLATAIINTVSNNNITSNLKNVSKCISYFNISTIICGFMYFLTILLSILTANAFI